MDIVNTYGGTRRIRFVECSASILAQRLAYDHRQRDTWTREGVPADAVLIDVQVRVVPTLSIGHNTLFVFEHLSFDEVAEGAPIPEQRVTLTNVRAATQTHYS